MSTRPKIYAKLWTHKRKSRHTSRCHPGLAALRISELARLFSHRYGETLPDDEIGRDYIAIMASHLAYLSEPVSRIESYVHEHAPWLRVSELADLVNRTVATYPRPPKRWKADKLGWRLKLSDHTRTQLRITTIGAIDCPRAQRIARRQARKRMKMMAKRKAAGAMTRTKYLATAKTKGETKPWIEQGISRATWYRQNRET